MGRGHARRIPQAARHRLRRQSEPGAAVGTNHAAEVLRLFLRRLPGLVRETADGLLRAAARRGHSGGEQIPRAGAVPDLPAIAESRGPGRGGGLDGRRQQRH